MIRTPLNKRPEGLLVLNTTYGSYSAGTAAHFIEYCDIAEGVPHSALVRMCGVQQTVPLEVLTERRVRYSTVPARKKGQPRKIGVFK